MTTRKGGAPQRGVFGEPRDSTRSVAKAVEKGGAITLRRWIAYLNCWWRRRTTPITSKCRSRRARWYLPWTTSATRWKQSVVCKRRRSVVGSLSNQKPLTRYRACLGCQGLGRIEKPFPLCRACRDCQGLGCCHCRWSVEFGASPRTVASPTAPLASASPTCRRRCCDDRLATHPRRPAEGTGFATRRRTPANPPTDHRKIHHDRHDHIPPPRRLRRRARAHRRPRLRRRVLRSVGGRRAAGPTACHAPARARRVVVHWPSGSAKGFDPHLADSRGRDPRVPRGGRGGGAVTSENDSRKPAPLSPGPAAGPVAMPRRQRAARMVGSAGARAPRPSRPSASTGARRAEPGPVSRVPSAGGRGEERCMRRGSRRSSPSSSRSRSARDACTGPERTPRSRPGSTLRS